MDRPPVIEVEDVTKVYDLGEQKVEALKGVSLRIFPGEIVALMGPSGSGKSTLMNLLGFLDRPTTGQYRLNGEDVGSLSSDEMADLRNHEIGFVFQNYNLLARTTSLENAELPSLYNGVPSAEGRRKAREMLALVGLADRETHRPTQLSGGQQQRVAIARALLNDPRIILADEPTGNLDTQTGAEIIELFKTLNREKGITVVFVTHDPEVASHGQRIVHFKDGLVEREEVGGGARSAAPRAASGDSVGAGGESAGAGDGNEERAGNGNGTGNDNGGGDDNNGSGHRRRGLGTGIRANVRIALRAIRVNKLRSALDHARGHHRRRRGHRHGGHRRRGQGQGRQADGAPRQQPHLGLCRRGNPGRPPRKRRADHDAHRGGRQGYPRRGARGEPGGASGPGLAQVVYGNKNWHPSFTGTTPDYLQIMNWGVESGSNFTDEDMLLNRKVALIGQTVSKELFGDEYPIGQTIRLKHIPFEVAGVLKERGTSSLPATSTTSSSSRYARRSGNFWGFVTCGGSR